MKIIRTLIIIGILLSFYSCSDIKMMSLPLQEQKDKTNLSVIETTDKDTVTYKIYENNSQIYLVNSKTKLIEKQIIIEEDDVCAILIITLIIILLVANLATYLYNN